MFKNLNKYKDEIGSDNRILLIITIISFVFCLIPIFLYNEEYISEDKILLRYMHIVEYYIPIIDFYAQNAADGLYYTIKLQWAWTFMGFIFIFCISFLLYSSIFICSLFDIPINNTFFINKILKDNKTSLPFKGYFMAIISFLALALITYYYTRPPFEVIGRMPESTMIGSLFGSVLFSVLAGAYSLLFIESLSQFIKMIKIIFKYIYTMIK